MDFNNEMNCEFAHAKIKLSLGQESRTQILQCQVLMYRNKISGRKFHVAVLTETKINEIL